MPLIATSTAWGDVTHLRSWSDTPPDSLESVRFDLCVLPLQPGVNSPKMFAVVLIGVGRGELPDRSAARVGGTRLAKLVLACLFHCSYQLLIGVLKVVQHLCQVAILI